ncbi:Uncharacterized protein DAT39_005766 [Clarias magur]|uniref:Uncharacterized protein n=1 Tax=Clarias magur TaxID=1594786 RepID=A0A8J4XDM8_CLAMG|nr:Uncharacterized protein DAT39_005766 [Clarias magur]
MQTLFSGSLSSVVRRQSISGRVQNCEHEVVQNALLYVRKCAFHQSLHEEEVNQRCLVVMKS